MTKNKVLLILHLLDNLSFEIRFCLQKYFKNYILYCLLKVVYQPKSKISNLFNFKDVANTRSSSHIVYKFISRYCNATYGQNQIHFFVKASEHLGITFLTRKFFNCPRNLLLLICFWMVIKLVLTIF